jgi:hypothetical protein
MSKVIEFKTWEQFDSWLRRLSKPAHATIRGGHCEYCDCYADVDADYNGRWICKICQMAEMPVGER